jgi:hypothetical protein
LIDPIAFWHFPVESFMPIKPFSIAASDEALRDLQQRLNNARWAGDFANDGWDYGVNGGCLRELEEPAVLTADIGAFFKTLRSA